MSQRVQTWLFRLGTVIVAGTLLYLGFRGIDVGTLAQDLRAGRYIWAFPLVAVTLVSHVLRAFRWRLLLHALPRQSAASSRLPIGGVFSSLMIGYMVNYVVPRFGEIVRTSHLSLRQKQSFSAVFGTVVAERLFDALTLGLALMSLPIVLGPKMADLFSIVTEPVLNMLSGTAAEVFVVGGLIILALAIGVALFVRFSGGKLRQSRFSNMMRAFREGLMTIGRSGSLVQIGVLTVGMWTCYAFMAYLPLRIFGLAGPDGLGIPDAWALMLIGSVGMVVPSPGGIGSFHFLTIQALVLLWGTTQAMAASYAIFTHMGQMLLYLAVGAAIILIEGVRWSDLKKASLQDAAQAGFIESSESNATN